MKEALQITTERLDDFVLLLAMMHQMELPTILDRQLPGHWLQQGLSWGWTASIWLAHIVSEGDHRKLTVRDWVRQAHSPLEAITGLDIRETDFTEDRLSLVLRHLSDETRWQAIEQDLGRHLVRVYALEEQPIRVDATTVSGYREGGQESLWQVGHRKDDPTVRQITARMATLDPLGLPLALDVVSGEQADDRVRRIGGRKLSATKVVGTDGTFHAYSAYPKPQKRRATIACGEGHVGESHQLFGWSMQDVYGERYTA
jgi:transposase